MKTEYLLAGESGSIEHAATLLNEGRLVVFPTDTVYGLGAAFYDEAALAALYEVKARPAEKGIPILLADNKDVWRVAREIPASAQAFMERFWPGPLTIIVPRRWDLPPNISPDDNVAVRIPAHDVARAIIRAAGGAVATSSANVSGAPAANDAREALQALEGRVAAVVDDGPAPGGMASTIVDCTVEPPQIVREGALTANSLSLHKT